MRSSFLSAAVCCLPFFVAFLFLVVWLVLRHHRSRATPRVPSVDEVPPHRPGDRSEPPPPPPPASAELRM